jgi:hypothetical protein
MNAFYVAFVRFSVQVSASFNNNCYNVPMLLFCVHQNKLFCEGSEKILKLYVDIKYTFYKYSSLDSAHARLSIRPRELQSLQQSARITA